MDVMREVAGNYGNPTAPHAFGQRAGYIVDSARETIKSVFQLDRNWDVIFTATCTEANNIALRSYEKAIVSAMEHKSVIEAAPQNHIVIPVDSSGLIDLTVLSQVVADIAQPTIVSVIACNNETGIIQPLHEVAAIVKRNPNLVLHSDMAQALTKMPLTPLVVDMFSISGHKIGGPAGVAALVFNKRVRLKSLINGGGQERGLRSGTHNVPAIAALDFVLRHKLGELEDKMQAIRHWRDSLGQGLQSMIPNIMIAGSDAPRAPNVSCIITPGLDRKIQVIGLDARGVCVGFGSSCAAGGDEPPAALVAMGYPKALQGCAIRVSMGWKSQESDVEVFLENFQTLARLLV